MGKEQETFILLIECKDQKGILASICQFIAQQEGNIIRLHEFADEVTNQFFARVEWSMNNPSTWNEQEFITAFEQKVGKQFSMDVQFFRSHTPVRTAIFVSKYAHCLEDVLYRTQNKELNIEVPVIISNHEDLQEIAKRYHIPFYVIPIDKDNKPKQEHKQREVLDKYDIDLVVLARYMQILSENFVADYKNQIINIHHSFLPAFAGAKPYHAAYKRGVKIIGATAHIVTSDLDEGPIICQDVIKTSHKDTIASMILKGKDIERNMLSEAIHLYARHQIIVSKNKTIIFD